MKLSKKIRSFCSVFLIVVLLLSMTSFLSINASALEDPAPEANAVFVFEGTSDTVLYSLSANERIAPASTTKVMTAMLVLDYIDTGSVSETDIVTVAEESTFDLIADGSTQNIRPGEEMSVGNLLRCAMISSANEACNALGIYISGSIENFVSEMNAKAKALGCTGTHFANTHGLPNDNHYTTAHDICKIFAAAYKYPAFREIIKTREYTVPATNLSKTRTLTNTNRLLGENNREYYEFCTGGKTGYTDAAGYCLVSASEQNGLTVFAAVMGTEAVTLDDGYRQTKSFSESKKLYEWAFANFSVRTMLSEGDLVKEIPVKLGDGADSVVLCPDSSISALLPNDADLSLCTYDIEVFNTDEDGSFTAPISKGERVGTLVLKYQGKEYGTVDLITNRSIDLQKIEFVKEEVKNVLGNKWIKIFIFAIIFLFVAYFAFVIIYNANRRKKRRAAHAAAIKRMEELRRNEGPTTGKSFEDIVEKHHRRQQDEDIFR